MLGLLDKHQRLVSMALHAIGGSCISTGGSQRLVLARYARGASLAICGAVVARTFNFIVFLVAARMLGRQSFGALTIIQSTAFMFSLIAIAGFGVTASRFTAACREKAPERLGCILGLAAATSTITGVFGCVLLTIFAPYLAEHALANVSLARPLALSATVVLFTTMNGYQVGALSGFEAFGAIARCSMWSGLASLIGVAVGTWWGGLDGAVIGLALGQIVNWVLSEKALRSVCRVFKIQINIRGWWQEANVGLGFALPAFFSAVVVGLGSWYAAALLAHKSDGYIQLAMFGAADRWRSVILFIPTSLFCTMMPILSSLEGNRDRAAFTNLFWTNLRLTTGMTTLAALLIAVGARPLMRLFGRDYSAGYLVLVVLALTTIPQGLNTVIGQRVVLRSMWARFGCDCLWVFVFTLAALFFVPRGGALGVAIANAVAYTATVLALVWCVRYFDRLPFQLWDDAISLTTSGCGTRAPRPRVEK